MDPRSSSEEAGEGGDVTDTCQVTIKTETGHFDVTYRTEHNGYYGGFMEYRGEYEELGERWTRITKDGMPT